MTTCQVFWGPTQTYYLVDNSKVLLQSLLERNCPVEFECQFGHCRSCAVKLKEGSVHHEPVPGLTEEEREEGWILLCSSRPASDQLILSI